MFYRINSFEINIPPLRECLQVVDLLAEHFARKDRRFERSDAYTAGLNDLLNFMVGKCSPAAETVWSLQ